jgi:hypothetical protein
VTALQFTQISGTNVTYRWRSRSGAADTVLEGQSGFSEPFHPSSPPPGVLVTIFPGATDLLTFPAGGLRVVWEPAPADRSGQRDTRCPPHLFTRSSQDLHCGARRGFRTIAQSGYATVKPWTRVKPKTEVRVQPRKLIIDCSRN